MSSLKRILSLLIDPRSTVAKLEHPAHVGSPQEGGGLAQRRVRFRDVALNLPLLIGAAIVVGLFLLVLFGPLWAPRNPYIAGQRIVPHYDLEREEYISPPLPPSDEFVLGTDRWGNDLLSLLMYGARNTLIACTFITMVRVILGLTLGGVAGWNEGRRSDQLIMGLIVVITSMPMLISSIILIYALDIRRGLVVFIMALSLIGWAEIAQYIRSEFMVLRKMPFIEGARSAGLNGLEIAVRHVLPNVLPQLLVITFLEMGAVMMLLGELGFVGVYIGGGSRMAIEVEVQDFVSVFFSRAEIPEWGAVLAEGFQWLRSKPFVVFPPALAFFVSVLGFNALGEGIRRLIEQGSIPTGFLLKKRMLLLVVGLTVATVITINSTGPAPWYARAAQAYSGSSAYEHITALTNMNGRGIGQEGGAEAAAYIAEQFRAAGLEPGWMDEEYVYPLAVRMVHPLDQPRLVLDGMADEGPTEFRHQLDFGFVIDGHGGSGEAEGGVTFVGFQPAGQAHEWESFKGLDLRNQIVLLQEGNAPQDFATEALIRGARGVLWITGNGRDDVRSQKQLADAAGEYLSTPTIPIFRIRPAVAQALLERAGLRPDLSAEHENVAQAGPGWFTIDTGVSVHMSLSLSELEEAEVPCILGYKYGSDYDLASELVVVFAAYDGLGTDPDGTVFPAANHGASGVGLLLEMAELWQEQDLEARRSVLFMAWGGGQLDHPGAREFLQIDRNLVRPSSRTIYGQFAPVAVFYLDYVGAGSDTLLIHPDSSSRLRELMEETATEVGIPVSVDRDDLPPFRDALPDRGNRWITFAWSDAEVPPDQDTLNEIETDKLGAVGEAAAWSLIRIVREESY